jgi:hypothetical protein
LEDDPLNVGMVCHCITPDGNAPYCPNCRYTPPSVGNVLMQNNGNVCDNVWR